MRAIGYLDSKKGLNDGCFHEYTATPDGRLGNLFWCDTMCRYDYSCFGDVLAFDATYKTNIYKRPLVMLLGVNHHFRTCFFGCAILVDETSVTYTWLLRTFIKAMNFKRPKSIITDGCLAMAAAIRSEMPNARHRLCEWHLERNIQENLHNEEFTKEFKWFTRMSNETRFEQAWSDLLGKYGLTENMWVREYLYGKKEMWSDAFLKGHFFAGQRTTQRCESMNAHQHINMGKRLKLHKLVVGFDAEFERLREGESIAEFKTKYGEPVIKGPVLPFDKHAASEYTRAIYSKFKFEMDKSHLINNVNVSPAGNNRVYTLSRYLKQDKFFHVVFNEADGSYECSCRFFESVGYLCSHLIHVLKCQNLEKIPDCLILTRWTRKAKDSILANEPSAVPPELCVMVRYGALSSICNRICHLASQTTTNFNDVRTGLTKMLNDMLSAQDAQANNHGSANVILDPIIPPRVVTTRGVQNNPGSSSAAVRSTTVPVGGGPTNASTGTSSMVPNEGGPSSASDEVENIATQRKCTVCRQPGHTKRTCKQKNTGMQDNITESVGYDDNVIHLMSTQGSQNMQINEADNVPVNEDSEPISKNNPVTFLLQCAGTIRFVIKMASL
ncbi:protein FAR-RED ELONGATED HYPOCOTYL 3-like [Tripterygium wilfordii]|uniref:protein FAR-RED ELONGATED HYPOCOTYL 3-like n=1 Tax=Tripterygium wilfordii TaxID=458696 RepID=UPI0018F8299B|nr:protein FAR-RED ELONGATED HYPOCOTYL 3-like [Tripterygium wilfordii]